MNTPDSISITSGFDSGNIIVNGRNGTSFDLAIAKDHRSDFYQWFHFRLCGARDVPVTLRIANAGSSAYPDGWKDYRACASHDRQDWYRLPTAYANGALTIAFTPQADSVWIAYFAPYSIERHHDLVARTASLPGVVHERLGATLDGQDIDLLTIGEGPRQVWLYARQHPGESMAEWWMEGMIERLSDPHDPVARSLRRDATFHIVPNMNPDGSRRGHLRTNAAGVNLNREWHEPTLERSPEVYHVLQRMDATGVDFAIDVHGDEAIPHVFIAGFEGIPNWTEAQGTAFHLFRDTLARRTPDFQTKHGYPVAGKGKANLSMSTNQLANRFGCVAATLEMPFKDNVDLPDERRGWSPERSKRLGAECLGALHEVLDRLPPRMERPL
jgi:murein tripeptide amidase MpaA